MEFLEPDFGGSDHDHEQIVDREDVVVVSVERKERSVEKTAAVKKAKKSIFESGDISSFPAPELAALFRKHLKKTYPSITDLELEDVVLADSAFAKGSGVNGNVGQFERFLMEQIPDWRQLDSLKPTILILSSSAIRSVDLLKFLPQLRSRLCIAKLFAKHIKLAQQKAFLASHRAPVAIGTPARILKLGGEEERPIDLEAVTLIVIDTFKDGKDRTVFDVAEVRKELMELLCKSPLRARLNSGQAQITFF